MSKALLVDDSRAVRLAMRRITTGLGYEGLEAENGQLALEQVRANPDVDFVLLDWNMPVMDGLEFLRALREEPMEKQPIVIMCTTENSLQQIRTAINAGANEYIMKPFTEDVIKEKLEGAGVTGVSAT
ncbi:MAG: response regulator [Planctomycetaceae bacterium]